MKTYKERRKKKNPERNQKIKERKGKENKKIRKN